MNCSPFKLGGVRPVGFVVLGASGALDSPIFLKLGLLFTVCLRAMESDEDMAVRVTFTNGIPAS